jgi:hypothetical protein
MNLQDLFQTLTVEERAALAKKAETDPGYLWQLSTKWRDKKPSLGLLQKLVAADSRLTLGELVEEFAGATAGTDKEATSPHSAAPTAAPAKRERAHREPKSNGHKERR